MTVEAKETVTKALTLGGSSVAAIWTEGDTSEVWSTDGITTNYGTLTAERGGCAKPC